MNNKILIAAAAAVVIVVVSVFLFLNKSNLTNKSDVSTDTTSGQDVNSGSQTNTGDANSQTTAKDQTIEVALTSAGFNPNEIKIKAGSTIIWANNSGKEATVNSDPHPTHFLWPFLNLGNFADGQNFSVIFEKPGVYTYHNHFDPNQKGTVTVE